MINIGAYAVFFSGFSNVLAAYAKFLWEIEEEEEEEDMIEEEAQMR